MSDAFFDRPILNSPYECPRQHWELDAQGQPTQNIIDSRRRAEFITPIPKPRKRKGPPPTICIAATSQDETSTVAAWLIEQTEAGVAAHECGVFVRSGAELDRARAAVTAAGIPFKVLDDAVDTTSGYASVSTMHLAKGLEFRVVAVMACDDEVIPLQSRIETVGDDADLQEVYDTERHLLYVACTRARDHLLVTSVEPASEFLDDLRLP